MTVFNPIDDKYCLNTHFGYDLNPYRENQNYRTLHLVDSRSAMAPQHFRNLFDGRNITIKEL